MRFEKFIPAPELRPFIRYLAISENDVESAAKILPSTALVAGFQYTGSLALAGNGQQVRLNTAGITGISDHAKTFISSARTGTVLVYFSETGLAHFTSSPAHELFNQSISLDHIFSPESIRTVEEKLAQAKTDRQRIGVVEKFLLSHLSGIRSDALIIEAVRMIYQAKGAIRIKELHEKLFISQSPFEKRFRKLVGTSPKKFASVVRFHTVLGQLSSGKSLTEICYENNFFDPSHFSKDFRQFTGDSPEDFRRLS